MKKLSALLVGILLLSGCGGGGDSEEGKRVCEVNKMLDMVGYGWCRNYPDGNGI